MIHLNQRLTLIPTTFKPLNIAILYCIIIF